MKKRIMIVVYALLLCVTASFAWLSNFQANEVSNVSVDFSDGALTVIDPGFDAYIEVKNANGAFEPVVQDFVFDKKQMVPDTITPFNVKIKNKSTESARKAKLGVAIRVNPAQLDEVNLLDVIYIDAVMGDGFGDVKKQHVYIKLSEAQRVGADDSGEYFLWIYGDGNEIEIPATGKYVTITCSFYYDQNATAAHQNKTIEAMAFRLE